jgi:hypothetical protein
VTDALLFLDLARTADLNAPNVIRAFVITRRRPRGPVTILERLE